MPAWKECWKQNTISAKTQRCPNCDSDEIEETKGNWINLRVQWANWRCGMCEFRWREWMAVVDIEEIEDDIPPVSVPSCLTLL